MSRPKANVDAYTVASFGDEWSRHDQSGVESREFAAVAEKLGLPVSHLPLSFYRSSSLATMRTDSRDRFGTPLEQRFTRKEIERMMLEAGLHSIRFSESEPYWVALGIKG